MGISGHILGERKLRRLQRETGLPFDRAFNRNGQGVARLLDENGECRHFAVDYKTWEVTMIDIPTHWTSCRREDGR